MQIRCRACTKTIELAETGQLPASCPHCAQAPGSASIGPYDLVRLIATGGMGEVYLARHRELGSEVALKVLPTMPLDSIASLRERFAREARLTAKVQHPGVVKVHGSDVAGDRPYLVLEFVAGQSLRARLGAGPVTLVEAARIAAATAEVLAAAHDEGVLHRDIKPDNVMLQSDGNVRVLDFGIARCLHDDTAITRTGEMVGTPEYMAPEQLLEGPQATSERTDVHALGVLLYELLTGRSPFHGANVFQALKLVESLVPASPSSLRRDVPVALDGVIAQALAKDPQRRVPSARAFAQAVLAAVPSARLPLAPAAHSHSVRNPWLLATVALAIALGALIWWRIDSSSDLSPGGVIPGATPVGALVLDLNSMEQLLRDGQWSALLAAAETQPRTLTEKLRGLVMQAFVQAHLAWPLAIGAPVWLGATDTAQCERWLGSAREMGAVPSPSVAIWRSALSGDRPELPPVDSGDSTTGRARLLSAHLGEDSGAIQDLHADPFLAEDALARLLAVRLLPLEQRADAFAAIALRLPITSAEHWLARSCQHHHRGDAVEGTRAAELAWLSGAGELAVLIDAFLQLQDRTAVAAPWRSLPVARLEPLRKRVAAGDATDAPAGVLLLALLDVLHGLPADLVPLHSLPPSLRRGAQRWCLAQATLPTVGSGSKLLMATALGAMPDYGVSPWRETPLTIRPQLDAEAKRGR